MVDINFSFPGRSISYKNICRTTNQEPHSECIQSCICNQEYVITLHACARGKVIGSVVVVVVVVVSTKSPNLKK